MKEVLLVMDDGMSKMIFKDNVSMRDRNLSRPVFIMIGSSHANVVKKVKSQCISHPFVEALSYLPADNL